MKFKTRLLCIVLLISMLLDVFMVGVSAADSISSFSITVTTANGQSKNTMK